MDKTPTTTCQWVTCFANIYPTNHEDRNPQWRIQRFHELAQKGFEIIVFVCPTYHKLLLNSSVTSCTNVRIVPFEFSDLFIYSTLVNNKTLSLPLERNPEKDTLEYLSLMNCKLEFIHKAMAIVPNTPFLGWIDFSITYISVKIANHVKMISETKWALRSFLAIAGCWEKDRIGDDVFRHKILWRFCGGFFIGDRDSLADWWRRTRTDLPFFLSEQPVATWEVNFWAWLERYRGWRPNWYLADHNETICHLPLSYFVHPIVVIRRIYYDYPVESFYTPMSASYIEFKDRHWLTTRCVNYRLDDWGHYLFPAESKSTIRTINILCELDPKTWKPIMFRRVEEDVGWDPTVGVFSEGLEDVRMVSDGNQCFALATTVNYSPHQGKNRMILLDYDLENAKMTNGRILEPEVDTMCEKNWVPFFDDQHRLHYIYSWSPSIRIGTCDSITGKFKTKSVLEPLPNLPSYFEKIRGSTILYSWNKTEWAAVVHFSQDRVYYHMLVRCLKTNCQLVAYSDIFVFGSRPGIEYCIGWKGSESDTEWVFWVSDRDANPSAIFTSINTLLFNKTRFWNYVLTE